MYNIIKSVIATKRYDLADMLKKIDTLWIQGSITEAQREELIGATQGNAKAENSIDVLNKLAELDKRISALEAARNDSAEEPTEGEEIVITYPDYEANKWYYNGDVVNFEGINYVCTAPIGSVCVWSPVDYPAYWSEFKVDSDVEEPEVSEDPETTEDPEVTDPVEQTT